jgi:hypothetical protein
VLYYWNSILVQFNTTTSRNDRDLVDTAWLGCALYTICATVPTTAAKRKLGKIKITIYSRDII